jgi:ABC-type Fe3+/spermidine/putrescine transport system ATPase subunit
MTILNSLHVLMRLNTIPLIYSPSQSVGKAENGTFSAIIGPSGSGKTSLLDCISLRNPTFTGCLRLNGQPVGADFFLNTGKKKEPT